MDIREQVPLAPLTTFRVGGPAKFFAEAKNAEEVCEGVAFARTRNIPLLIIGAGANLLVADQGFNGFVLRIVDRTFLRSGTSVIVGAGFPLGQLLHRLSDEQLSGLEFLIGVPGSVGGAIVGNAGTASEWISRAVKKVKTYNSQSLTTNEFSNAECAFSYRMSRFKVHREEIVLQTTLKLSRSERMNIVERMRQFTVRRSHQPSGDACAGCVFVNPDNESAGRLIERAGLKGKRIGRAEVSSKHANFIVNLGGATAEEIVILISYVKQHVRDLFHVELHEEIRYVGF